MIRPGTCKHFNGTRNECCKVGVNYVQLAGGVYQGYARRIPCTPAWPGDEPTTVVCDKLEYPTAEELAEEERRIDEMLDKLQKVQPLISQLKREYKGRNGRGTAPCPVCGGNLHWTIAGAYNGHTSGRCDTEDCLNWIE